MKRFVRTIKLALLRDKMKSQKERSAELYKSRKESGLCPRCGKPLDRDGHYCSECLEKERKYRSETKNFVRKTEFVRSAIKKSCMETRNNAYYAESITGSMA